MPALGLAALLALGSLTLAALTLGPATRSERVPPQHPPTPTDEEAQRVAEGPDLPLNGGVLRLANRGDVPAGWDPMRTSSIALHHVAGSVFGPGNLVKRCRANMYMVCPYLATSWHASQDFTVWTFTLREGVRWHDGQPFSPDDARFWLELAVFGFEHDQGVRAPAYFRGNLGPITRVESLPGQVRVVFSEPTLRFPEMLLDPRLKIAHPEHLMRPMLAAGALAVSPLDVGLVGLGPFRVAANEPGSRVVVQRFEDYWERDAHGGRLPYLDGIEFVITPDPVAMDLALRTGRLDGGARGEGHYLSAEREEVYLRALGDAVRLVRIGGGSFRLAFNLLRDGPWQDVRVRRAIALWIDGDAALTTALGGQGYRHPDDWPGRPFDPYPFMLWPRLSLTGLETDRAEALQLLTEAGYPNGFRMTYLCRAQHAARCEFLQAQLAGLGIELVLDLVDEGGWNRARLQLGHDAYPGANFSGTVPEATEAVYGRYAANPDAYAKHDDPVVDALYHRLRAALTVPQRVAVWRALERHLLDQQVHLLVIAMTEQVVAYGAHVRGLVIPAEDGHTHTDFATVWLARER